MANTSEKLQGADGQSRPERDEKHNVVSLLDFILQNPEFPVSGGRERLIAVLSGKTAPTTRIILDSEDFRDPDDVPGPSKVSRQ